MSTNQNTNKNNNKEPSFDEYRAYEELRMIFVIAIETQDFTTLEARIDAWEKRYPLAEFTDEDIIRKIKAILNKDFLSRLLVDYLAAKILHEQEKQKEFYDSLKSIIDTAKNPKIIKLLKKKFVNGKIIYMKMVLIYIVLIVFIELEFVLCYFYLLENLIPKTKLLMS